MSSRKAMCRLVRGSGGTKSHGKGHAPKVRAASVCSLAFVVFFQFPALAQDSAAQGVTWAEQKCRLYQKAFDDALQLLGKEGVRDDFLMQNRAHIEAGCIGRVKICPLTEKERDLADVLTIMTMNEGMASTFVPFGCSQ